MSIKDRLPELKQILSENQNERKSIELELHENNSNSVNSVFTEIDKIRKWIEEINENTQTMQHLVSDTTFYTSKNLKDQLDSLVVKSNAAGLKGCGALREFEDTLKNYDGTNNVSARIARLQYATTKQLYSDALTRHEVFLEQFRQNQMALLQQQIKLTNQDISQEECQSLLEANNIQIFVDNFQKETLEAKQMLRDIEIRHEELLRIENAIKEVKEMFMQMAILVNQQQDLIDTVEFFASQATDYVEQGGKDLKTGNISRRKARKKKVSLIICLAIGLLIVILILILT